MKLFISVISASAISILAVVWFFLPQPMSQLLLSVNNASAGLSAKVVETPLGDIHYLEGGSGETVVLLHGIYARKEHWTDLARELTSSFHVIALDLPGFGDNQPLDTKQYGLHSQAANLSSVLNALDIKSAHFGANSMGAKIAAIMATKESSLMKSLAFVGSPLGVPTDIQSDMDKAMAQGQFPLVVKSVSDFHQRNNWLFPEIPFIPSPIMTTWMTQELSNPSKNEEIWYAANNLESGSTLLQIAPRLTMRTLVIWCNEDRIFHVSGADLLDSALPHSRKSILDNCGHVPMLDKPIEVSEVYLAFLHSQ